MKRLTAVLIALACAAALLGGCGDGEEEPTAAASPTATEEAPPSPPVPSPTLSPEERAEVEALLKSMAITPENDMPPGFTLDQEGFNTNEEAAEDYPEGEEQGLADYTRWGRLLGYRATYSTEPSLPTMTTGGTIGIQIRLALYADSAGASAAMAEAKDRLADPERRAGLVQQFEEENPQFEDVVLEPMSFGQVGDDTSGYQLTGTVVDIELGIAADAVYQVFSIRRGRALGAVMVGAIHEASPIEELEAMAQKLDQRMAEALE